jgi:hypothetical protein
MTVPAIKLEGFSAKSAGSGEKVLVEMKGNADIAVQEQLKTFCASIGAAARLAHAQEVVFDFRELYFMNSSCLSLLLRFINEVSEGSPQDRFTVRFRSNPNLRWQQKSLSALRAYAEELVIVE